MVVPGHSSTISIDAQMADPIIAEVHRLANSDRANSRCIGRIPNEPIDAYAYCLGALAVPSRSGPMAKDELLRLGMCDASCTFDRCDADRTRVTQATIARHERRSR